MKCSLGISNFLEEISSLSHSVVFLYFFALIAEEGFLISLLFFGTLHSDVYIFPFLLCFSLLFFSQLFVRPPRQPTEHLICAGHYSRHWRNFNNHVDNNPCSHGASILVGDAGKKKIRKCRSDR